MAEANALLYNALSNYADSLTDFFLPAEKAKILELTTDDKVSTEVFGDYKKLLRLEYPQH